MENNGNDPFLEDCKSPVQPIWIPHYWWRIRASNPSDFAACKAGDHSKQSHPPFRLAPQAGLEPAKPEEVVNSMLRALESNQTSEINSLLPTPCLLPRSIELTFNERQITFISSIP